ncbi:hypothetical protein K227x_61850 [Rubripirellula lacrimiformis]|uniref:Uncharacterized protein n=1 Tax=Rubripirellula lacrimiformis TaxID=1930273 RepID=A0A517NKT5_9BACT|nr:hypothetical protein [Rubripirellula lacrimiformis]QDT07757.1 hypothetical protein K227x_61850 [Rubripirellula lacrimiformis]
MPRKSSTFRASFAALWIRALTSSELRSLVNEVKLGDPDATSRATVFVASESFGLWHNRARAKLCRYFKNHPPTDGECKRMVDAIVNRLLDGRFSEQFKDQLSMAIRFDADRLADAAKTAACSDKDYVRRYAAWISNVLDSS